MNLTEIFPAHLGWRHEKLPESQKARLQLRNGFLHDTVLQVLEWFVDIYDSQDRFLISDRYNLHPDFEENLRFVLKTELELLNVRFTQNEFRLMQEHKWPYLHKKFQMKDKGEWRDFIAKSRVKLL